MSFNFFSCIRRFLDNHMLAMTFAQANEGGNVRGYFEQ